MKKIFVSMAMCTAVLLGVNACQKETAETVVPGDGHDVEDCKIDYSATLEQPEKSDQTGSKTYLGGDNFNLVYWYAENQAQGIGADKIVLLGVGGGTGEARHHDILAVKSVNEDNKRSAIFELSDIPEVQLDELACAVYPSDCVDYDNTVLVKNDKGSTGSLDGVISGTVAINFPATQTYVENSFGNGANIAVGKEVKTLNPGNKSGRSEIQFRNAFGVLELHLKGSFKVGKIKVTGHNGEKLNGKFTVNLDNIDNVAAFTGAVATTDRTDGDDVITLDCTRVTGEGVQLNTETATTFDIVVPVNAFKDVPDDNVAVGGFSAIVYDATGNHTFDVVATVKDNTIHRSKIKAMPELTARPAYQKADYVKSPLNQNPYIDTGYKPKSTDCTEGKMRWDDNELPQNSFYGVNPLIAFTSWYDSSSPIYRQRWSGKDSVQDVNLKNKADVFTIKQDVNKFYFNGELKKEFTNSSWSSDHHNALLFARCAEDGKVEECVTSGRIYYFTIKNSGVWIRNYVPCYVVSGQTGKDEEGNNAAAGSIGMLDIVTGRLYVNRAETGSFEKGSDISNGY